jgi:hypothetical protein
MYLSAAAKVGGGVAQKNALDNSASEITQEGGQSVAAGIQGAIQDRRRAAYVESSARARTAAGGLTTTGTSAIDNLGQIKGEGEYRALMSMYQGEDRASELDYRASQLRDEGSSAVVASVLSAGASFYSKYGENVTKGS